MSGVTLKDIAKECGISFSAVSKALKGSPEIGADTIKLVTETARRMGYSPNSAARALRTRRSYDIGVIFEDSTGSGLQHQFFAKIFDAINVTANNAGYDITFLNNMENRDYLAQARYRGCDGIAIVSTDFLRSDIVALKESGIPSCSLDYVFDAKHSAVLSDNFKGMAALTEYAVKQGHKKIAFVHGEMSEVTKQRLQGFNSVLTKYSISIPDSYIIPAIFHDTQSCVQATKQLLALGDDRPTCIFYPDDFACMGGIEVLNQNKIKFGKDLSIAGYDGTVLAGLISPKLATYEQNAKEIGQHMAFQLIKQIENPDNYVPKVVTVKGQLIEGESIGKIS
ncbi:MAG: LacI family transcriptional regulator [Treponema sp.]|nr:LacI family transcriptional regulator [Treponema sp.]